MSNQTTHWSDKQHAMTLVEILISMVLFGIIAAIGYGGLSNLINLQNNQNRIQSEQEDLQRVLLIMARDFYQIVPRPIRNNTGSVIGSLFYDSNNNTIEFTRSGNSNPISFNRSQFLRVGYQLEEDTLYRLHWKHLDRILSSVAQKNPLVREVDSISYRFMDENKTWKRTWSNSNPEKIPTAIEMILTMQNGAEFLHTFPLIQP